MIFYGPISERSNWRREPVLTVVIETIEELEKVKARYLDHHQFVAPTHPQAKPGQWKQLHFVLPDGNDFETCAKIASVMSTPGASHVYTLFHLDLLTTDQIGRIKQVLIRHRYASLPEELTQSGEESSFSFELSKEIEQLQNPQATPPVAAVVLPEKVTPAGRSFDSNDFDLPTPPDSTRTVLPIPATRKRKPREPKGEQAFIRALLARNAPSDEKLLEVALPEEARSLAELPASSSDFSGVENATEARQNILAFLVFFTKAVQRSGYYADPNHPETRKARRGLYAFFRKMLQNKLKISFVRRGQAKSEDLLIEGITDRMISARETMPLVVIEMYLPKFLEYLNRRCLLSFSIKRTITEAKFDRFIDLLSEYRPNVQENSLKEGEEFSRLLREREIFEVQVIFDEEFIASDRKLPWQAELTLSRLRKDLKVIPMLKEASAEELKQIKLQIFRDTLHPLSNPAFLLAVLLNADLVMQELKQKLGFEESEVECHMVDSIDPANLTPVAHRLVDRSKKLEELKNTEQRKSRKKAIERERAALEGVLGHLVRRLGEEENPEADATLELLFNEKLILFDVLPLRLQEGVKDLKRAEAFVAKPDTHLAKFENPTSDFDLLEEVRFLRRMIPHLYREREYDLIRRVVLIAQHHMENGNTFTRDNTRKLFEYLAGKAVLAELRNGFDPQKRDRCRSIASLLVALNEYAVPWLLDVLKNHENRWVRKLLVDSLVEIGPIATPFLHNELVASENRWFFLRNCLVILSKIGKNESFNRIRSLLKHGNAIVRREALKAMIAIEPEFCENDAIQALSDADKTVKMAALNYLSKFKSTNTDLLRYYLSVLDNQSDKDDVDVLVKTLQAISRLKDIDESMRMHFELSASRRLAAMYKSKLSGLFVKPSDDAIVRLKVQLCVALGTLDGRKESLEALRRAAKDRNAEVSSRARQALDNLKG